VAVRHHDQQCVAFGQAPASSPSRHDHPLDFVSRQMFARPAGLIGASPKTMRGEVEEWPP
jgi:hypothetical protein